MHTHFIPTFVVVALLVGALGCVPNQSSVNEPSPRSVSLALSELQEQNRVVLVVDKSTSRTEGRIRRITPDSVIFSSKSVSLESIESVYRRSAGTTSPEATRLAIIAAASGAALGAFFTAIRSSDASCGCALQYVGGGTFIGGVTGLLVGSLFSDRQTGWKLTWKAKSTN